MHSFFVCCWGVRGTALLPVKDELFITDVIMCLIALILSLAGLIIFIFFVAHFLVNAKKDELEKNNEHVISVLNSVQQLSKHLQEAGSSLSKISENESASAEKLAATSEQLKESSNILGSRTDESMENLSELSEWEGVVADNVEKVENTSKELLQKSVENEKLLNNLHTINGQVSQSMTTTTDMEKNQENAQFVSINSMAESNANDTTQVATQASVINDMVEEMSKLLKRE